MKTTASKRRFGLFALLGAFFVLAWACSSDPEDLDQRITIPLGDRIQGIRLAAEQVSEFTFSVDIPSTVGTFESVEVDLDATLEQVEVTIPVASALKLVGRYVSAQSTETTAQATVRVGDASQAETVCQTGRQYGPYTVSGDAAYQPTSVDPGTASADAPTIQYLNGGTLAACVQIQSPVDAFVDVNGVVLKRVQAASPSDACTEDPANMTGIWVGTYSCTSSCGDDFGGPIQLELSQKGRSASYTDDIGDTYSGDVCGNRFAFSKEGATTETEDGTFVLESATTATKTSEYSSSTAPFCSGTCQDTLTLMPTGEQ